MSNSVFLTRLHITNLFGFVAFIIAAFTSPKPIHENYLLVLIPGVILLFLSLYYIIESKKYILETINEQEKIAEQPNYRNHFFVGIICLIISIGLIFNNVWVITSSVFLGFLLKTYFGRK